MPLDGDFKGLEKVQAKMQDLADVGGAAHRDVGRAVGKEVQGLEREQFEQGIAPSGEPWRAKKTGGLALQSRRLGSSFTTEVMAGRLIGRFKIAWLSAHHEGHIFPPRRAGGQQLYFTKRGRLTTAKKFARRLRSAQDKAIAARGVLDDKRFQRRLARLAKGVGFVRETKQHGIRARILPARPLYPTGALPPRWQERIGRGVTAGVLRWYGK